MPTIAIITPAIARQLTFSPTIKAMGITNNGLVCNNVEAIPAAVNLIAVCCSQMPKYVPQKAAKPAVKITRDDCQ
jgi:hypothetical protein